MTQNGGLDVLIACVTFGVLLTLLGWVVLRHHDDPVRRATRSDENGPVHTESSDGRGSSSGPSHDAATDDPTSA